MASSVLNENWRVKITSISKYINKRQLSQLFGISETRIYFPKIKADEFPYAWIDGFNDENEAKVFANRYSGKSIGGETINCTPAKPRDNKKDVFHSPQESLFRTQNDRQSLINAVSSRDFGGRRQNNQNQPTHRTSSKSNQPDRNKPLTTLDTPPLISFDDDEVFSMPTPRLRRTDFTLSLISMISNVTSKPCLNGIKCYKAECEFDHPDGWNACRDGEKCDDYECFANHPPRRRGKCKYHGRCKNIKCKFLHPSTRAKICYFRGKCRQWNCQKLHPFFRPRRCNDKEYCTNEACLCLHPPERLQLVCLIGIDCRDISCKLKHPAERPPICEQKDDCTNFNCTRLHSSEWNPCEAGEDCEDENCSKIHPTERTIKMQAKQEATSTNAKNKTKRTRKPDLKSIQQRTKERENIKLPILHCRSEFLQRLEQERILVVTAETGSGKSTQLPQYAAEHFGSLVVCTQPRVVAALSLARRVAEEYDGKSVGESVGYQVGGGNRVSGTHIMFMTDAALIRESQRDPSLKNIKVLIIDEAHERSLNTDIVIGISKLLLSQRPNDFFVVIASATIDPSRFLNFFDRSVNKPLEVKGRVFQVEVNYKPPVNKSFDQKVIETHIICTLVELYPRKSGHTLVFLPGQGEIERALKKFKSVLPDDCIAYPLYGSQSPEDQEKVIKFDKKDKRMVVFCTNVAETSLTIPDVRLVIDSGWAKEARYDVQRRLTIIETVRISRSSADQRRGRAGRTAAGHCVRLYEDSELKRPNIEPEILRSSLDLVLLQLIRLQLDPQTFPFMDQPKIDIINHSFNLLTKLECIENQKITKKGELFSELPLDPRLSSFIIDIYTEYECLLELTTTLVAILSAPGTIFFMGGAKQEDKQQAKTRVALQAQNYKSDLIHLYSVYNAWKNAGTKETQGKCSACSKLIKFCICRIKHSNENGLNNKILQNISNSCTTIIKQIKQARWLKSGNKMPDNLVDIIGIKLAQLFPEQCGYILVPKLPIEGVRLVSTDIRANITNMSVFMQKIHVDTNQELYQHFVAMNITQLPSGNFIIEKLHPIPRTVAAVQSPMEILMTIECVSLEVSQDIRRKLITYQSEPWAKWIVYEYDRPHSRFVVWGLSADKPKIIPIVESINDDVIKKALDNYELIECGPIKGNFQSGLVCTHINKMIDSLQLNLKNIPCQTVGELKDWLKKNIDIEWNEVQNHRFDNRDKKEKNVQLMFKNENVFRRAASKISSEYLNDQGNIFQNRREREKDTWGRELVITVPGIVTDKNIIDQYGSDVVMECIQINKQNIESLLKLNNLPSTRNETFLRKCLQENGGPTPKNVHVGRTKNNLTGWAKVTFNNEQQRNHAAVIYNIQLCQNSFLITVPGKEGPRQKSIQTKVEKDDPVEGQVDSLPPKIFLLTTNSREAASRIFSKQSACSVSNTNDVSTWKIDGSATVTVSALDLYPNAEQNVKDICQKFDVKVKSKDISKNVKRFTFSNGSPQKTSLAASMVAQTFAPMNIKWNTDRQKLLFNELDDIGKLKQWARELNLVINKNKWNTNIEIRGPQIAQGQLMRKIADYSDEFNRRFQEYELSSSTAALFGGQKAASAKLKQIADDWSPKLCLVSFIPKTSIITVFAKPTASPLNINECKTEVVKLLNEIQITNYHEDDEVDDGDDDNDNDQEQEELTDDDEEDDDEDTINVPSFETDRRCVFCKEKSSFSTNLFRICGHSYCRCAAQALSTSVKFPFQCKDCHKNIHIRDIRNIFSNNEQLFMQLLKSSIQLYLIQNVSNDDRVFCPNDECDGLVKLNVEYQTCLTCGENVCPKCQAINDEYHLNRTCAQAIEERKRHEFLPELFEAAKKFVQENWPADPQMQPVGRMDKNPYLEKKYKSLTRFLKGVEMLGQSLPPDLSKGFFAYHGTAHQALVPICKEGFDPKRRSGQAYGRGEYFGVSASVSHGYSKKGGAQNGFSQMIITFLLRGPQTSTHGNFCYVVDNPTDWQHAFNLPVLVVTYGQNSQNQPTIFPNSIPDVPDDEPLWKAPFRWYWCQDNRQFEPYSDAINVIFEKSYEQWKLHGGSSIVDTPPLTRYVDDVPQPYRIDYQNNIQTNLRTSYTRKVERRPIEKLSANQNWYYRNEQNLWIRYESLTQDSIEKQFQLYRSGQGPSCIEVKFPGRPETYQIDFLKGQQMNKTTNVIKCLKRQ